MAERVVFLSEITDNDGNDGDAHFARRWVPTEGLDAQFETEIVDCKVHRHDQNIPHQLALAVARLTFDFRLLTKRDVFLQPESG